MGPSLNLISSLLIKSYFKNPIIDTKKLSSCVYKNLKRMTLLWWRLFKRVTLMIMSPMKAYLDDPNDSPISMVMPMMMTNTTMIQDTFAHLNKLVEGLGSMCKTKM